MRAQRFLAPALGGLLLLVLTLSQSDGRQPPDKDKPPPEPEKLNDLIEESVRWYDVFPDRDAASPLAPTPVLRWRNVVRGQKGEAMMVIWPHHGRPVAMASIYPWDGALIHEFDSLSRGSKLIARDKDRVIWSPETAGAQFKDVPRSPAPAKTAAERLRQMKGIAAGFHATMTGWQADNADQEILRLLPRELYRYALASAAERDPDLLDGALFAYVQGTDPEVVLMLEAIGTAEKAVWQYAFARATSGGLEVRMGDTVVWTAPKHPPNRRPALPHFSMRRLLPK